MVPPLRPSDDPRRGSERDFLDALLSDVAVGEVKAFEELYDQTAPRIAGLVRRIVRNPAFTEEVTQEVYVDIWRTAPRFDPTRGTALSWMLTIAHRRAVDRVRSEQSSFDRDERVAAADHRVPYDEVSEAVEHNAEVAAVRSCLQTLSDVQRESVSLAYYGGLTYPDVAGRLGVPLGTVKTRLRDGLQRLRTCLGGAS